MNKDKVKPEDLMLQDGIKLTEKEIAASGETYTDYYNWRSYRSGLLRHFQNYPFDEYLKLSRELFWNSMSTQSEDLRALGLDFSIAFARKETMDFLGRLTTLNIKPRIVGNNLDALGVKVMQGMYKKWRFKNNEKVESFWELLYGLVNGTVVSYVGYNNTELQRRYLDSYNMETGDYKISKKPQRYWDDVCKSIVPIEDMYFPKIWERNIQKQGKLLWRTQMTEADFHEEFGKYPLSKYVFPGMRIAEDSLFFTLLGGTGTTTANMIEVLRHYDWYTDEYKIVAGGLIINRIGKGSNIEMSPMPFDHKMAPFTLGILNPLDEKLTYGLSVPFMVKDPHKILNTSYTMMVERELRAIDPPILTSDLEAPELIYGQHKVIPVQDVSAYKEFQIAEPSGQFFTMLNSLQQNMSSQAQGGSAQIIPSRQPKSSREVMEMSKLQQQAMSNALVMYYDILRQQVLLVLKTALQFYSVDKYQSADESAYRTLMISDVPLSLGGIGDMKIRIVKNKKTDMELFLEGIKESAMNGKKTEIVEVPLEFLQKLEMEIDSIELEPDNQSEMEAQSFVENVINPMLNIYVPQGVASLEKTFMRHMEKLNESVSDFASEQVMNNMAGGQTSVQPQAPQQPGAQEGGAFRGNMAQVLQGTKFGMQSNKGLPTKENAGY